MTTLVAWPTYSLMTNQLALLQRVFMRMSVFSAVQKPHKWLVLSCWYTPHPARLGIVRLVKHRTCPSDKVDLESCVAIHLIEFYSASPEQKIPFGTGSSTRGFFALESAFPPRLSGLTRVFIFPSSHPVATVFIFFPSSNQTYAQYIHISMQIGHGGKECHAQGYTIPVSH